MEKLFLCCDLDRTLIPNGDQAESEQARPLFSRIAQQKNLILAYVTGRNKEQIRDAIRTYDLPVPDYAVGDVGATIYQPDRDWHNLSEWSQYVQESWHQSEWKDIKDRLNTLTFLLLQEPEHQHRHKLSYYTDPEIDQNSLEEEILKHLLPSGIQSNVIFSQDEKKGVALVDILPQNASKRHAIEFLRQREKFNTDQVMFAGDSGNDLDALTGGVQAVLVKNASDTVRKQAISRMTSQSSPDRLFLAKGDFLGMNGNYSAGILEGLAHFFPETLSWMADT